jgi:hypothetical protein
MTLSKRGSSESSKRDARKLLKKLHRSKKSLSNKNTMRRSSVRRPIRRNMKDSRLSRLKPKLQRTNLPHAVAQSRSITALSSVS